MPKKFGSSFAKLKPVGFYETMDLDGNKYMAPITRVFKPYVPTFSERYDTILKWRIPKPWPNNKKRYGI